ncbi:MAG: hypothetical protein Q8P20_07335 [bacterium]|nr:hypothetical protein [bacterium]
MNQSLDNEKKMSLGKKIFTVFLVSAIILLFIFSTLNDVKFRLNNIQDLEQTDWVVLMLLFILIVIFLIVVYALLTQKKWLIIALAAVFIITITMDIVLQGFNIGDTLWGLGIIAFLIYKRKEFKPREKFKRDRSIQ